MSVSAVVRAMGVSYAAVRGWVKKTREAMGIMEMEREGRNPSAVDIPHSVKAMRGIDSERAEAKAISFDEMRSRVEVRKGGNRRSARARAAMAVEADGSARFDFEVGDRDLPAFHRLPRRPPPAEKRRRGRAAMRSAIFPPGAARGKGGDVNRNEGLRAKLRTRLNRLGRSASGYSEKLETLANSLALARIRERLI